MTRTRFSVGIVRWVFCSVSSRWLIAALRLRVLRCVRSWSVIFVGVLVIRTSSTLSSVTCVRWFRGGVVDKFFWFGASVKCKEDDCFLRGNGRFFDDVEETFVFYLVIGRCLYLYACIWSIDTTWVFAQSGVEVVLIGEQVMAWTESIMVFCLFFGLVLIVFYGMVYGVARYEGEFVVVVVVVDRYVVEAVFELIDVDYEPLFYVIIVEDVFWFGVPQFYVIVLGNVVVESIVRVGELDRRLADVIVIVEGTFRINWVSGVPIETRGVIVCWVEDMSTLELWVFM